MNSQTDPTTWYQESLHDLEQALYGQSVQFPVPVELDKTYEFGIWDGQALPDQLLAYDTETSTIEGNEIPELALATVHGDQGSCYFIHPINLPQFILQHSQAYWCCHNATFDFWVTAQHLQANPQACAAWWDMAGDSRLICTMLLDSLIRLARIDAEPISRDLATVAAEYSGLKLNKDDPFRLRYGELLGLSVADWMETEIGFWTYAGCDPVATLKVAQRQFQIANELIAPYRGELLPDAQRRFGPLTVCLQVQGAIALDYISRTGIHIDLRRAQQLRTAITELVEQHQQELERLLPGCFKRYGPRSKQAGQLQRTPAGVPKRNAKAIKQRLQKIAQAADEPIRPAKLKDGTVTDAVKYWAQHQHIDPLVEAYVNYSQQAKLAQFFKQLDRSRIYPKYRPLVRTGRSSCSNPNLQQLPRDARFREMIVAPPGYWLLQIDYSVLELRALAQVCLKRYGRSRLAELFHEGIDCHRYTAAALLGISLEQFEQLSSADQKHHRQAAKAIGFGTPGGLGAASLVSYAKHSYGVELSLEEAKDFRKRLITEIYSELATYLQDNQLQDIARNLLTTEQHVRQALPKRDQIQTASRIISGCDGTPDGDEYALDLIAHVWQLLQNLNKNPELMADLVARKPSTTLMRRIFFGHALSISGRLRGHVGFSQRANTPFQSISADGNKLALFRLLRAGYQVCGFVHDEVLVLIPDGADYDSTVNQVQQILCKSMQELCPDVPIRCEYLLADRWYKDVDEQPMDSEGRVIPYRRKPQQVTEQPMREQSQKVPTQPATLHEDHKPVYDPAMIWADIETVAVQVVTKPVGKPAVYHSSAKTVGKDEWETPAELFALLDQEFHFTLDVCALPENTKCPAFYSPEDDGLAQPWQGTCWMNPPYSQVAKWMAKAYDSARHGTRVVCLVPSRTGTKWWHDYACKGHVRLLKGRLRFSNAKHSAPFPSAVVIFGDDIRPGFENWDWKESCGESK